MQYNINPMDTNTIITGITIDKTITVLDEDPDNPSNATGAPLGEAVGDAVGDSVGDSLGELWVIRLAIHIQLFL